MQSQSTLPQTASISADAATELASKFAEMSEECISDYIVNNPNILLVLASNLPGLTKLSNAKFEMIARILVSEKYIDLKAQKHHPDENYVKKFYFNLGQQEIRAAFADQKEFVEFLSTTPCATFELLMHADKKALLSYLSQINPETQTANYYTLPSSTKFQMMFLQAVDKDDLNQILKTYTPLNGFKSHIHFLLSESLQNPREYSEDLIALINRFGKKTLLADIKKSQPNIGQLIFSPSGLFSPADATRKSASAIVTDLIKKLGTDWFIDLIRTYLESITNTKGETNAVSLNCITNILIFVATLDDQHCAVIFNALLEIKFLSLKNLRDILCSKEFNSSPNSRQKLLAIAKPALAASATTWKRKFELLILSSWLDNEWTESLLKSLAKKNLKKLPNDFLNILSKLEPSSQLEILKLIVNKYDNAINHDFINELLSRSIITAENLANYLSLLEKQIAERFDFNAFVRLLQNPNTRVVCKDLIPLYLQKVSLPKYEIFYHLQPKEFLELLNRVSVKNIIDKTPSESQLIVLLECISSCIEENLIPADNLINIAKELSCRNDLMSPSYFFTAFAPVLLKMGVAATFCKAYGMEKLEQLAANETIEEKQIRRILEMIKYALNREHILDSNLKRTHHDISNSTQQEIEIEIPERSEKAQRTSQMQTVPSNPINNPITSVSGTFFSIDDITLNDAEKDLLDQFLLQNLPR